MEGGQGSALSHRDSLDAVLEITNTKSFLKMSLVAWPSCGQPPRPALHLLLAACRPNPPRRKAHCWSGGSEGGLASPGAGCGGRGLSLLPPRTCPWAVGTPRGVCTVLAPDPRLRRKTLSWSTCWCSSLPEPALGRLPTPRRDSRVPGPLGVAPRTEGHPPGWDGGDRPAGAALHLPPASRSGH